MGPNRGALPFSDEARHGLRRPARKYGDEMGARTAIPIRRVCSARAAPRVSSINHGRPVSRERAIRLGACLRRLEVRGLKSTSISSGGFSACECGGDCIIKQDGGL